MHFLARIAKLSKSTAYAEYSTSTADMAGFTVAGCELIVESKKPDKGEPIKNNRTYKIQKINPELFYRNYVIKQGYIGVDRIFES